MAPRFRIALLIFRLAVLAALGVSTALLIDYFRPLPAFCDVGSGCDQIRASGKGKVFEIPLPVIGLAGFAVIMTLSLLANTKAQRASRFIGFAAGFAGIALLIVQGVVLKVFCKLCVTVDVLAIVIGLAATVLLFGEVESSASSSDRPTSGKWLWPVATLASMLIPAGWSAFQPSPPVPREIAARWVPDKMNVVEFIDFQCPFCRELHPVVHDLLEEYGNRVNLVRFNVPLPQHPQSRDAARAYCCADLQSKGPQMADALFGSNDLSPEACEKLAASLGMSISEFRACVRSPETDARIDEEMRQVRSAGLAGLPTVWVNDEVIVGRRPDELRDAFTRAANGKPVQRLPTSLLWGAFAIALAAVGGLALKGRPDQETS